MVSINSADDFFFQVYTVVVLNYLKVVKLLNFFCFLQQQKSLYSIGQ